MSDFNAVVVSPTDALPVGLTFIEQLHALSVQLCPSQKVPYLTGISENKAILLRGSCGSWSCVACGARNARQWQARILNHINTIGRNQNWYFMTVTAHEKWRGKSSSLKNIRLGWKKLYNRMRRQYGLSAYVKVWEYHKDGSFHLHLLINKKIGQRWLKSNARQCGMGYQAHSVSPKNGGQVVGYISKYLLKSFDNAEHYAKGMRRIEVSHDWTPLPELEETKYIWQVTHSRKYQDSQAENYKKMGLSVSDRRPTIEDIETLYRNN